MVDPIEGINNSNAGESEMRVRLDNLYKIAGERQQDISVQTDTRSTADKHQTSTRDRVNITPQASVIAGSGLDKNQSTIRRSGDTLEFNLRFDTDKFSEMSTKGSFSPVSKEMSLFVSFNYQDAIKTDSGSESRTYNARLKLEASNVSSDTFSMIEGNGAKFEQNVDNMLQGVLERAYSKQYPPTSVVLQLDDIADLISEKGGIFQKVSRAMMLLNSTLARALEGGSPEQNQQLDEALVNALNSDGSIELKDFSFQLKEITPAVAPTPLGSGTSVGEKSVAPAPAPVLGGGSGKAPEAISKPSPAPVRTSSGSEPSV